MGLKRTTFSFKLAIIVTFLFLSSTIGSSRKTKVSPFCKFTKNKPLCAEMAKGATTWPKAMTNMITATIKKAEAQKPMVYGIAAKLPSNVSRAKEAIDSTCKETFDMMLSRLKECLGLVKSDPTSAMNSRITGAEFTTCRDGLEEFGVSLEEVNEFDDELNEMKGIILIVDKNKKRAHK